MSYNQLMQQIKYLIAILGVVLFLMCERTARSETLGTDKYAHLGVSYILTTAQYGFWRKGLGCTKAEAFLLSGATTLLFGFAKEYVDMLEKNSAFDTGDMAANVVGVGLSIGTILMFDF